MNPSFQTRLDAFLACKRIAVIGYSRQGDSPANAIYHRFQQYGYEVVAINPRADQIEEVPCFASLAEVPEPIEAAVLCTPPGETLQALEACAAQGIQKVWIHRSINAGSSHPLAESLAEQLGLELIPFGCPMMFVQPDLFHRCLRWIFERQGKFIIDGQLHQVKQAG